MGRHQSNAVFLTASERDFLEGHIRKGDWSPREVTRAKILLMSDQNSALPMLDYEVSGTLNISLSAVRYRRKRFHDTKSVEDALFDSKRPGRPTIIDGATDAHITVIACSKAPKGHSKWTLRLIRDRVISLNIIDNISHTTVARALKKSNQAMVKKGMEDPS